MKTEEDRPRPKNLLRYTDKEHDKQSSKAKYYCWERRGYLTSKEVKHSNRYLFKAVIEGRA